MNIQDTDLREFAEWVTRNISVKELYEPTPYRGETAIQYYTRGRVEES